MKRVLVAAAAVVLAASGSARADVTRAMVLTSLDDVRACTPLDGGKVAVGTAGGLAFVRPDGTTERVMTSLDGLPETRVHSLYADGASLWIGTERGPAELAISGDKVTLVRAFVSPPVRAIVKQGDTWMFGTWGGGVLALAPSDARPRAVALLDVAAGARVSSLAVHQGALFAGTAGGGLLRFADGKLRPVAGSAIPVSVWSLASQGSGDGARLFIGSIEGVISLGASGDKRESDADARALTATGEGVLVGAYGRGLFRLARATSASELPFEARFVQAIGARGAVRCAGTTRGLFVSAGAGGWQKVVASELRTNDIAAIARDGDTLYIGTYDRGLAKLEDGRVSAITGAPVDANVNALAIERRGADTRLWIGTARGLTVLDPSGQAAPKRFGEGGGLSSNAVHAVAAVSGGMVLVGTERGATVFRGEVPTVLDEKQGLPLRAVWAVGEGPGGMLLLGTSAGLYYGQLGGSWQRASMATGHLHDDWVTALLVRGDVVFVGTYNGGVSRLTWGGAKSFAAEQLGGGYVNPAGLFASATTLYAATMDGLVAKDLAGASPWREVTGASPGRDVTQIVSATGDVSGELWLSSRRGIARFRP